MSKAYWFITATMIAAYAASGAEVGCPAGPTDYSYCAGHNFTEGNGYPYVEDIQSTGVIVGSTETSVMTTCATLAGDPTTDPTRRTAEHGRLSRATPRLPADRRRLECRTRIANSRALSHRRR
ncbi:MAG TPA: hypothetical protein VND45_16725 [Thermoanaerobaculia bacterium]|jgi:hypothetical protein|nr:hypothetical protein [Thermoanaerobaculia bacterium]